MYSFYLNTPKFQLQQDVTAKLPSFSSSSSSTKFEESSARTFSPDLSWTSGNRLYLRKKLFMEADVHFSYSLDNSSSEGKRWDDRDTLLNWMKSDRDGLTINMQLPIAVGWGRIERVEDARLAVYILDDLRKAGKLAKEPSEEEIYQVAQFISQLRNERFFDSREKKIWEIQRLVQLHPVPN